ncbi:MAG: hypothetical protein WCK17_17485 [Verrucomicrobiota bacterium]
MNKLTLQFAILFLAAVVHGDDAKKPKNTPVKKSTEAVVAKDDVVVSKQEYLDAVREAKAAGFEWECDDTTGQIQQGGDSAQKKETGRAPQRKLNMEEVSDLGRYRDMLRRLRPTELNVFGCENLDGLMGLTSLQKLGLNFCPALQNLDGLKGLTGLRSFILLGCSALQNVDGLKDLTGLQTLLIRGCPALQNVGGLKGLTGLRSLVLSECPALQNVDGLKDLTGLHLLILNQSPALQNVDGLKGLTRLQGIDLSGCPALQNVDGLKGLTDLKNLQLGGSRKIPAAALRELRAALPNTDITFPDGTKNPPQ